MLKIILIAQLILLTTLSCTESKQDQAEPLKQDGNSFLNQNKKVDGVKVTDSGLQYRVMTMGNGLVHPKSTDSVKVHYHGTLTNGTVFDSSVDRGEPISFPLNRVIKGWTEGLQLMVVGEKTQFVIPSDLAYGTRGTGSKIGPNEVLIFDVELIAIN